jgi:hypothetical protein
MWDIFAGDLQTTALDLVPSLSTPKISDPKSY